MFFVFHECPEIEVDGIGNGGSDKIQTTPEERSGDVQHSYIENGHGHDAALNKDNNNDSPFDLFNFKENSFAFNRLNAGDDAGGIEMKKRSFQGTSILSQALFGNNQAQSHLSSISSSSFSASLFPSSSSSSVSSSSLSSATARLTSTSTLSLSMPSLSSSIALLAAWKQFAGASSTSSTGVINGNNLHAIKKSEHSNSDHLNDHESARSLPKQLSRMGSEMSVVSTTDSFADFHDFNKELSFVNIPILSNDANNVHHNQLSVPDVLHQTDLTRTRKGVRVRRFLLQMLCYVRDQFNSNFLNVLNAFVEKLTKDRDDPLHQHILSSTYDRQQNLQQSQLQQHQQQGSSSSIIHSNSFSNSHLTFTKSGIARFLVQSMYPYHDLSACPCVSASKGCVLCVVYLTYIQLYYQFCSKMVDCIHSVAEEISSSLHE
jgi:hypothetical protein